MKRIFPLLLLLPAVCFSDISNTATVTYTDTANNPYSATSNTVTVITPPFVTLLKSGTLSGNTITYKIVYTNTGKDPAKSLVINDALDAGTAYVAGSGGALSGSTVTFNVGDVAVGGTGSVTFQVTVK